MGDTVVDEDTSDDLSGHPLLLEPYLHQVSGHSCLLTYPASGWVLKPCYTQELAFYTNMPEDMRAFTPAFYGVADVRVMESHDDGVVNMYAELPQSSLFTKACTDISGSQYRTFPADEEQRCVVQRIDNNKIQITHPVEADDEELINQCQGHQNATKNFFPILENAYVISDYTHWNFKLLHKMLMSAYKDAERKKFIVLENVTHGMRHPCVMDVKLGTRQHSDNATEIKKRHQIKKCLETTSSTLGLRICGMKKYRPKQHHNVWCDKYFGRSLSEQTFYSFLCHFLSESNQPLHQVIVALREKLRLIRDTLLKMDGYRFYSSSLIIVYELSSHSSSPNGVSDKIIGDAISSRKPVEREETEKTGDEGSTVLAFDVFMVDFELSSQQAEYSGPDSGVLFGIENLISMLETMSES